MTKLPSDFVWATMIDSECARDGTFVSCDEIPKRPNPDAIRYVRLESTQLIQLIVALRQIKNYEGDQWSDDMDDKLDMKRIAVNALTKWKDSLIT